MCSGRPDPALQEHFSTWSGRGFPQRRFPCTLILWPWMEGREASTGQSCTSPHHYSSSASVSGFHAISLRAAPHPPPSSAFPSGSSHLPPPLPSRQDPATSLDGFLSTSPTPPPLLSPWLSTVTMHIRSVSHVCSLSCSVSSVRTSSMNVVRNNRFTACGKRRTMILTLSFLNAILPADRHMGTRKSKTKESGIKYFLSNIWGYLGAILFSSPTPASFSSQVTSALPYIKSIIFPILLRF